MPPKLELYTRGEVRAFTALPPRRIAQLTEQKLIEPTAMVGAGQGSRVLYTARQVLEFDTAAMLGHWSTAALRELLEELRSKAPEDLRAIAVSPEAVRGGAKSWFIIRPPGGRVELVFNTNTAYAEQSQAAREVGLGFMEMDVSMRAHQLLREIERYRVADPESRRDGTWRYSDDEKFAEAR